MSQECYLLLQIAFTGSGASIMWNIPLYISLGTIQNLSTSPIEKDKDKGERWSPELLIPLMSGERDSGKKEKTGWRKVERDNGELVARQGHIKCISQERVHQGLPPLYSTHVVDCELLNQWEENTRDNSGNRGKGRGKRARQFHILPGRWAPCRQRLPMGKPRWCLCQDPPCRGCRLQICKEETKKIWWVNWGKQRRVFWGFCRNEGHRVVV